MYTSSANLRVLLLQPGAFSATGGIEAYNRLIYMAFSEIVVERAGMLRSLILNDSAAAIDSRYVLREDLRPRCYRRGKIRFAIAAAAAAIRLSPDLIVIGHTNFAPLSPYLRLVAPRAKQWFLTYGIEVWQPLSARSRAILAKADAILAISEFTRSKLASVQAIDPSKVALLPCALDPFWAEEAEEQAKPRPSESILTVARLVASEAYKGVDQVMRTLPALRHQVPSVRYEVIGDGDDRPRLEALAKELGVADIVTFRGKVPGAALAKAYAECGVFAMPSRGEGFGIVYLEAALFGKPSIAGAHGGAPEVVTNGVTGEVVDHDDTKRLADALTAVLRNPSVRERMGSAARNRLDERFRYETLRSNLRGLLDLPAAMSGPSRER